MRILIASTNRHKRRELERLVAPLGIEVTTPDRVPGGIPEVDEDCATFEGNATKKAAAAARATRGWALADDSGLEVEHLGGAPGVRSARYAGEPSDDAANNAKLLRELAGVAGENRSARFVCALALADPEGEIVAELQGVAHGRVLSAPRGDSGFGYDPLFLFTEPGFVQSGKTFAELGTDEKSSVSHRARAVRELVSRLPEILSSSGAARD